jgi:hypothetical protein
MVRKPGRAEKRARGNRASRAAEDAYRTGQGVGGIEVGRERRSRRAVNGVRGSGETRLRPGEGIEAGRERRSRLVEGREGPSERA